MSAISESEISVEDAKVEFEAGTAIFLDIRDPQAWAAGHIPSAIAVSDANVRDVMERTAKDSRIVIYCYHGNSSQGGAAFFRENGFVKTVSMSGGFEGWRQACPDLVTT